LFRTIRPTTTIVKEYFYGKDGRREKLQPNSETAEFIAIGKSISRNCVNMNFDELVDTYHKQIIALFRRNDMKKMKQLSKKQKIMP
jgi:hypothetical protein